MDGSGWWEPGFSLLEKEATDKQWGEGQNEPCGVNEIQASV